MYAALLALTLQKTRLEVPIVSSHNSPHLSRILGLVVLSSALGGGCAAPQAYVPFQQQSTLSTEARWQALLGLAKTEQWKIIESDVGTSQITAYRYYDIEGVRDRIKITLLPDRTVVETGSEIEGENGRWTSSADRCAKYNFVREKVMVAHIEHSASSGIPAPAERDRSPELVLPASRASRACGSGIR
jgi:hypothetical protein